MNLEPPYPRKGDPVPNLTKQQLLRCGVRNPGHVPCREFLFRHTLHPFQYVAAKGFAIHWCPTHGAVAIDSSTFVMEGEAMYDVRKQSEFPLTRDDTLRRIDDEKPFVYECEHFWCGATLFSKQKKEGMACSACGGPLSLDREPEHTDKQK